MALCLATFASCSSEDDPEPVVPAPDTQLHVINGSTYTLERFTVIFWNDDKETITNKEYGTFSQGETKNIDIPAGATQYYMGTYMYGSWFVSPTYKLAGYQTLSLTSDMVNSWTTISTSSAPAHITDLQPAE